MNTLIEMNTLKGMTIALVLSVVCPAQPQAAEWDLAGFAGLSSRTFSQDGRYAGQASGSSVSLAAQPELYWRSADGDLRFGAIVFGRKDSADEQRSHADLREATFGIAGDGWDVNIGVGKVFWGVTESRHLVDVINQSDLVEDIGEKDKLGQPMINLNLDRNFGRFELYVLPRFRERTFPGVEGRLRPALPIDEDAAIFESTDGKRHTDVSFRYSHYFGGFDIGAYVFDGTSREPRFEPSQDLSRLVPVYEQMRQVGVDVQLTHDAWLWKLEAISRNAASDHFRAAVTGIEYTFFGIRGSAADIGVLLEYLYDGRDASAPPTIYDNDLFVGTRLALNDSSDTSLLAGAVVDVDTREIAVNIKAERRVAERLTLDVRLRAFGHSHAGSALENIESDDYLELGVRWHY